jgi:hypothetical protein
VHVHVGLGGFHHGVALAALACLPSGFWSNGFVVYPIQRRAFRGFSRKIGVRFSVKLSAVFGEIWDVGFCMNVRGLLQKMCGDFFSSRWPYVVHKLSQSKPQLLVHPLHELAKTSDHFAIPYCT